MAINVGGGDVYFALPVRFQFDELQAVTAAIRAQLRNS
jgi:hypothetical protein